MRCQNLKARVTRSGLMNQQSTHCCITEVDLLAAAEYSDPPIFATAENPPKKRQTAEFIDCETLSYLF